MSMQKISPDEVLAGRYRLIEELQVALLPPGPHNTKLSNALWSVLKLSKGNPVKKLPSRVKELT